MSEYSENPVVRKRRRQSIVIAIVFLAVLAWSFSSGSWGNTWAKFSRFWLFDSGH
ncbi:MAG: hypothetical protein AB7F75_08490 [Planctomycetota bacterium]